MGDPQREALLLSGSEPHFERGLLPLQDYLSAVGVPVHCMAHPTAEEYDAGVSRILSPWCRAAMVLLVFNGHGSPLGWEAAGAASLFRYQRLVELLQTSNKLVLVVANTCYGQYLIKELISADCGFHTGVIAPWNSFGMTHGDAVEMIMRAWPERTTPEQRYSHQWLNSAHAVTYPGVQRWGAGIDRFFYPNLVAGPLPAW